MKALTTILLLICLSSKAQITYTTSGVGLKTTVAYTASGGGGGGAASISTTGQIGGAGKAGIIIIEEFQ